MPLYSFKDETGALFEVLLPMAEAPKFGATVTLNGKELTRLVEMPQKAIVQAFEFKAWSQKPWSAGAEAYDAEGNPCFTSKKAIQKYLDTQNSLTETDGVGQQGGEILGYGGKDAL